MTMSSTIQEVVLEFLSDKQEHSVQDIKHYLREQDVRDSQAAHDRGAGEAADRVRHRELRPVKNTTTQKEQTHDHD